MLPQAALTFRKPVYISIPSNYAARKDAAFAPAPVPVALPPPVSVPGALPPAGAGQRAAATAVRARPLVRFPVALTAHLRRLCALLLQPSWRPPWRRWPAF